MDPIKLVKQIALAGVITLIIMGGAGFYLGYSAGRGDLSEVRAYLSAMNIPIPADAGARPPVTTALDMSTKPDLGPVLSEIRTVGGQLKKLEKWTESNGSFPDVAPIVSEVRAINTQLKRLEASADTKSVSTDLSPVLSEIKAAIAQIRKLETVADARPSTPDLSSVLSEIKAAAAQIRKLETVAEVKSAATDLSPVLSEIKAAAAQIKKLETLAEVRPAATDLSPVLSEIKAATAQIKRLETMAEVKPAPLDLSPMLAEIKAVAAQMKKLERPAVVADNTTLPVMNELKVFGEQLRKLEKVALQAAEIPREDPKLREEVGRLRQLAVSAGEQLNTCQVKLASLDARPQQTPVAQRPQPAAEETQVAARAPQAASTAGGIVVLYDSFYLKKDQNKSFDDLDLKVALQGVASRSARVDVNNQTVSIAFGERKEIVYNNMTCELNLTETDLSASQARFNIACKK